MGNSECPLMSSQRTTMTRQQCNEINARTVVARCQPCHTHAFALSHVLRVPPNERAQKLPKECPEPHFTISPKQNRRNVTSSLVIFISQSTFSHKAVLHAFAPDLRLLASPLLCNSHSLERHDLLVAQQPCMKKLATSSPCGCSLFAQELSERLHAKKAFDRVGLPCMHV